MYVLYAKKLLLAKHPSSYLQVFIFNLFKCEGKQEVNDSQNTPIHLLEKYIYLRLKRTNCAPTYLGIYAHNFVPKSNECESALECEKRMPTRKCSLTWSYSLSFLLYLRFPVLFLFVSPFVLSGYSVV